MVEDSLLPGVTGLGRPTAGADKMHPSEVPQCPGGSGHTQIDQKNPGQDRKGPSGIAYPALRARGLQCPAHPKLETVPGGWQGCVWYSGCSKVPGARELQPVRLNRRLSKKGQV